MQTTQNVLKWSAVISGMTGLMLLGSTFAIWFMIQVLVVLTGISA